jgi:hypothetical protein
MCPLAVASAVTDKSSGYSRSSSSSSSSSSISSSQSSSSHKLLINYDVFGSIVASTTRSLLTAHERIGEYKRIGGNFVRTWCTAHNGVRTVHVL